jgi:hypothetical protein
MTTLKPNRTTILGFSVLVIVLAAYYKALTGNETFQTTGPSTNKKKMPSTNVYDYLDGSEGTVRISFRE